MSEKPLAFKLQKSTYWVEEDVWKRLFCFANRNAECSGSSRLSHRLTNGQAIERVELMRRVQFLRGVQTDDIAEYKATVCRSCCYAV